MPVESTGKAETGNWKLENGKWKMGVRWVTIFQFPIFNFPFSCKMFDPAPRELLY